MRNRLSLNPRDFVVGESTDLWEVVFPLFFPSKSFVKKNPFPLFLIGKTFESMWTSYPICLGVVFGFLKNHRFLIPKRWPLKLCGVKNGACCEQISAVWGSKKAVGIGVCRLDPAGDGGMKSSASTASLDSERLPPIASKRKPGGRFWPSGWDGLGWWDGKAGGLRACKG